MAGLSTAWRLSEPGWRDRFDSITIYQRGWRLGGKAASSRGDNGRIEEHGLHIWIGSYENAFTLLRECYAELDRANTDPTSPIQTWNQALIPSEDVGLADRMGNGWLTWLAKFANNDQLPGDPGADGRELTTIEFTERAVQLILSFMESVGNTPSLGLSMSYTATPPLASAAASAVKAALLAALGALADPSSGGAAAAIDLALKAIRDQLDCETRPDHNRTWQFLSLIVATIRGIVVESLVTDPRGFRAINDEDYRDWVLRHGAHPDALDYPVLRGLYDMVFGYQDGDPSRPAFAAGLMVFLSGQVLFQYKGSLFWKMTAGMGDVVVAPIYEALRRRGVTFEFFHRLDGVQLSPDRQAIAAITMGRQLALSDGVEHYEPLTRVRGLTVFPASPLQDQLAPIWRSEGRDWNELETHFSRYDDAESRVLRQGIDFDHVVLSVSLGMIPYVAQSILEHRPEWRELVSRVETTATQAMQLWLRPDEADLGWYEPGATVSAYTPPFETWASMPQTLWAEDWPDDDRPGTAAYYCGTLVTEWPPTTTGPEYAAPYKRVVRDDALAFVEKSIPLFFPRASSDGGFRWELLCGANNLASLDAVDTQYISVNIDPSDRYVQAVPGSDKYRLRPDESGYENLVLAGDWTNNGINSGCIESAVMSGLEAANAILGRHRFHRIRGFYLA